MPAKTKYNFPTVVRENIKIWRYMDITKFLSLLEDESLYLGRCDRFEDNYEGSVPHANAEMMAQIFTDTGDVQGLDDWSDLMTWARQWTFINCWHMNDHESAAMWKLYAKSNEAVAIQTTYSCLRDILPSHVYLAPVIYKNYDIDVIDDANTFSRFIHKRISFEHEKELRIIVQTLPVNNHEEFDRSEKPIDGGHRIKLDLSKLIKKVYVAPTSPAWFHQLVEKITLRYGYNFPVEKSPLDRGPMF